jgi:predicted lipoprotein
MQIDSIASIIASTPPTGTLAATTQVVSNGKPQAAVVEYAAGGYEAYVPDQIGPVATGSSIAVAESRLDSTVQFQA